MDAALRQLVRARAGNRCEYCHLSQRVVDQTLQIEHIIARQHQGGEHESNLALACDQCNLHKGPNLSAIDPETGDIVELFHPRKDAWEGHFQWRGAEIAGRTATGRATARLLDMNSWVRVQFRATLMALGQW
jgi:HNH endonuclease